MTELRYAFGANWQSFVGSVLDDARVEKAAASLRRMLGGADLDGRAFIDVGCGSGLFSLAACRLGAARVVGFDLDPQSVEASREVRRRAGIPAARWEILSGSILDDAFVARVGVGDVVYAWGVLHHTGRMWAAVERAVALTAPAGRLLLALYNDRRGVLGSGTWWHVKRVYNRAPTPARWVLEAAYAGALIVRDAAGGRHPLASVRAYAGGDARGMDFWHDVRDWLGGFPYEYASVEEVCRRVGEGHGLVLEYLNRSTGLGCNEFTFRRPAAGGDAAAPSGGLRR